MNWLDILIIIIIALSVFFGFRKGFLRKVLGIAGIILGFILAVRFYKLVSDFIIEVLKSNSANISGWIPVISFLVIIGIIFGFSVWIARYVAGWNSGTVMFDKILGAVLGFIQGLILASIIVVNFTYLNYPDAHTRDSSYLYPAVSMVAPEIFDKVLSFSPELKNHYEEYKKILKPL